MSVEFAFGPTGTWFFESPTLRKWRGLPASLYDMLQGGNMDVARTTCMALGENGSYVMGYQNKAGTFTIWASGIPDSLHDFLFATNSQGYLVRDVDNLIVTLGPNGSYFATDKKNSIWTKLPADLETALNNLKNSQGSFTVGFKCIQLGVGDNFIMITATNGATWQLGQYPKLEGYINGLRAANLPAGMFSAVQYIWLDAHTAGNYMVINAQYQCHGEVPDESVEDAQAIINTIPGTIAPAAVTFAAVPSPAPVAPQVAQGKGSHKALIKAVFGGVSAVTKVVVNANGGSDSSSGDSSGGGASLLNNIQQVVDWSQVQQVAQLPFQ